MKRYQLYLNPHAVNILDEVAEISPFTRSRMIQEAIDAASNRLGNLLSFLKPVKSNDYTWMKELIGSTKIKGKKQVNISENVDEIYYK